MRSQNTVRAFQHQPSTSDSQFDRRIDQLEALAAAGDIDAERCLRLLMDGQEPNEQYFGGACPVKEESILWP